MTDPEAIIRELADRGAPPSFDEETCWYCDALANSPRDRHAVSCAWRQAVEWVAGHAKEPEQRPTPDDGHDFEPQDGMMCDVCGTHMFEHDGED